MHELPWSFISHLLFIMGLVAVSVSAIISGQAEQRRAYLKWSGIMSLGVMLTGFALAGRNAIGWPFWLLVKIFCWLAISALCGLAFRNVGTKAKLLAVLSALVLTALIMVYHRPGL